VKDSPFKEGWKTMSLRITAILLAVLSPLGLSAADDGSSTVSPANEPQNGVHVQSLDLLNGIDLDGLVFQLSSDRYLSGGSTIFGIRLSNPEFPFSPRLLRRLDDVQINYGTGIRDAAQNLGEFNNPPSLLLYDNTFTSDALLPLIIPAGATVSDATPTVLQADAENCTAACGRCLNPADCPIDVVMAEEEVDSDCGEPGPLRPVAPPQETLVGQLMFGVAGAEAAGFTTTNESCSHAEPPLKAKVEHLLEAAKHLAGAGYEEEAKLFRVEAEAIQKASTRLLMEKRQELERLQREVAELEALTGQYQTIQISCRVLEFQRPVASSSCDSLCPLEAPGIHVLTGAPCSPNAKAAPAPLSSSQLAAMLHALEKQSSGSLKTLAEPVLVTMNGRPATLRSGGEFPILIPVAAEAGGESNAEIEWRNFGVTMQAVPFVLGNGKVRLSLETEVADRDFSTSVNLNGARIPGLTTSRFRSDVETRFGETVAIALNSTPKDGARRSVLVLVTAQQVEPQPEPQHPGFPQFTR